jgi:predicted DNA-binding transcriptional regulator AlpA
MSNNRLLGKKEIMERYGISRTTLRKWISELNMPVNVVVSNTKKYALESDLMEWENSLRTDKKNSKKKSK